MPPTGALSPPPEWRTSKKGKRFQIDTETGEIIKGNVGQSGFRSEARPLESTKPDKARYQALLKENDGDHKKAAHEYFREKLQGRYVTAKTDEGDIEAHFTGKGWNELKKDMAHDPVKAEIVPMLPEIILSGRYKAEAPQHDHPDISVFHTYRGKTETSEGEKNVIVDIAERPGKDPRNLVYSLTREGAKSYDDRRKKGLAAQDKKDGVINVPFGHSAGVLHPALYGFPNQTLHDYTVVEDSIRPFFEVVNIRFAEEA